MKLPLLRKRTGYILVILQNLEFVRGLILELFEFWGIIANRDRIFLGRRFF